MKKRPNQTLPNTSENISIGERHALTIYLQNSHNAPELPPHGWCGIAAITKHQSGRLLAFSMQFTRFALKNDRFPPIFTVFDDLWVDYRDLKGFIGIPDTI